MTPAEQDAMLRQRIGARIYFMRRRKRMTALALAEAANLHRNTVYRIEAGLSLCSVGQIWRIAEALDVKIEDFLRDSPSLVHRDCIQAKTC